MHQRRAPEFVIFTGPMMSGKTSALLAYADRCKYQKKNVVAFKPKLDDRYSSSEIVTHTGWRLPAHVISSADDIVRILAEDTQTYDTVVVDEAFMIKDVADMLIWVFREGVNVALASLDMSSSCKPFSEIKKMLPWATRLERLTAFCDVCGEEARYTYKRESAEDDDSIEIAVGGHDIYAPRCFWHHPKVALLSPVVGAGS